MAPFLYKRPFRNTYLRCERPLVKGVKRPLVGVRFPLAQHHPMILVCLVVAFNGAFTLDVKSVLNENLGGILGGTLC
jgi:hypothetical protein